jgi:ATP-dependent DNA helicase RecG
VGVDVPNASVMVIESAERFGLAQLHQLRGRVGRGGNQSFCILMSDEKLSKESRTRLEAMCQTSNGFELAELDLKLRGAGDINGTQQSGEVIDLKIANLALDNQILQVAQQAAIAILTADPALADARHVPLRELSRRYEKRKDVDFSVIS